MAPLGGCPKGCGTDKGTQRHSALLAALPSPSTGRLQAPSLWHLPLRTLPAQDCPGRRALRAGIQMRKHSAGGPVGDVIPQRLLWIPSQPRPGKLGAGGVSPKEEGGPGPWMNPPASRRECLTEAQRRAIPLLERRGPPRLEGDFVTVSSRDGPLFTQSPWLDGLGLWQIPGALPHTCIPPTTTWMDPWLLPDSVCQPKLRNETFAKSVPCSNTFSGSLLPTE